jgi:hypothetical protein
MAEQADLNHPMTADEIEALPGEEPLVFDGDVAPGTLVTVMSSDGCIFAGHVADTDRGKFTVDLY